MTPARIMGRRKRSEHYVNNKEFLAALEVYIAQVQRAKLNDADAIMISSPPYAVPTSKENAINAIDKKPIDVTWLDSERYFLN